MNEKLTWNEIEAKYDREWVELVDYDWNETESYPEMGVVRVHSNTRDEFDRLTANNPPENSAYIFVGTNPCNKSPATRSFSHIEVSRRRRH